MRVIDAVIWFAIGICGIGTAIILIDLLHAAGAQPCGRTVSADCYPWGAEGPAAERWSYASKSNYILRGLAMLALFGVAVLAQIWSSSERRNLPRICSVSALILALALLLV